MSLSSPLYFPLYWNWWFLLGPIKVQSNQMLLLWAQVGRIWRQTPRKESCPSPSEVMVPDQSGGYLPTRRISMKFGPLPRWLFNFAVVYVMGSFLSRRFILAGWTNDGYKYSKVISLSRCQRCPSVVLDIQHPLMTLPKLTSFLNHIIIINSVVQSTSGASFSWSCLQWIRSLAQRHWAQDQNAPWQSIAVVINWWDEFIA